jgi:hypothetical protein
MQAVTSEKQSVTSDRHQVTSGRQPVTSGQQPAASVKQIGTSVKQPGASVKESITSVKQSGTSVKQQGTSNKQPEISTKHLVISPKVQKQQQLTFSSDKMPSNMVENPVISAQLSVTKDQYPVALVLHTVTSAIESGTFVENIVNTTGSTVQEKKTLNSDNPIHSSDELLELPSCEHTVTTAQHPVSSASLKRPQSSHQ